MRWKVGFAEKKVFKDRAQDAELNYLSRLDLERRRHDTAGREITYMPYAWDILQVCEYYQRSENPTLPARSCEGGYEEVSDIHA